MGLETLRSAERILVCLRYGIGDLVMETPVLEALRQSVPSARIEALGARPATDLLSKDPRVDGVQAIQDFGFRHWGDEGDPQARRSLSEWIGEKGFGAVLDPSHAASGVAGVIRGSGGRLFDARDERPDPVIVAGGSGVDSIKATVERAWGIRVPVGSLPGIRLGDEDHRWAADLLQEVGGEVISLSPAASAYIKTWPPDRLCRLAAILIRKGFRVLLLDDGCTGPCRNPALSRLAKSGEVISIGGVHLLRVAALIARTRALVCNDTGLMHMAAAVGTPVVALFGPTEPDIYLPRQTGCTAVRGNRVPCEHRESMAVRPSRCQAAGRCLCGQESCIHAIEVEEVLAAVEETVQGRYRMSNME